MNRAESVSDSDSSTSSSWIFVDDCEVESEPDKNKYYLNCSSEPIQELTSHCLHSTSQEQDTDSDGISVISESDDLRENALTEEQPVTDNSNNPPIENVTHDEYIDVKDEFYFNKYIVLLWIVIAVTTPLLLNYFSTSRETVVIPTEVDVSNKETVQPPKSLIKEKEFLDTLDNERKYQENSIQILEYYDHQSIDVSNNELHEAKRKYDSKGEVDVHRLGCKDREHLCDKSSKRKNREKKGELLKDVKGDFKKKLSKQKENLKSSLIDKTEVATKTDEHDLQKNTFIKEKQRNKKPKNKNEKNVPENNEMKQKPKGHKKKNRRKESEFQIDGSVKKKHKKNKKIKKDNERQYDISPEENPYYEEVKKLKQLLEKKDRDIKELKKQIKTKNKQLKLLEYKILKELNMLRKSAVNGNQLENSIENEKFYKDKVNSTSADWYYKLYKGRSKFREEQHASDWVFDRADFRNKKYNTKDNWYWNWMTDREHLRFKKGDNEKPYKDKVNSIPGDWYYKLHILRSKLRNQQHASNSGFNRFQVRTKKRNKKNDDYWFWNWINEKDPSFFKFFNI